MAIPTLFTIVLLVFLLVHAVPGNPFQGEKAVSKEVMQQLIHRSTDGAATIVFPYHHALTISYF